MIIFDLDGTLADCEHRRHLLKPQNYEDICEKSNYRLVDGVMVLDEDRKCKWRYKQTGEPFKHGFDAFYEACDKDKPNNPVIQIFNYLLLMDHTIEIWSGRCESVRDKTESWLSEHTYFNEHYPVTLRMRPVGDYTPDDQLKESWLDEAIVRRKTIEYVFDDRKKVINMWRRRGIFVFDCNQSGEEF